MNIALVCIAKNEDLYIQEWIDYHLKIGFTKIFIYANDWNYQNNNSNIVIIPFNGKSQQINSYNDFKKHKAHGFHWAAFFDVDEFLVLHKYCCIKSFLENYKDCNAIGINWAMFGNNGHTKIINNDYSVLNRFTKRAANSYLPNKHIKTIVRLPSSSHQKVHCVAEEWYNLQKEKRKNSFNLPIDFSIAQINHYYTKSDEELLIKCDRGRADDGTHRNFINTVKENSFLNEIEDLAALMFFNEHKKCEHY